jgi:DNA-binding HxlR family transcriptional regulator
VSTAVARVSNPKVRSCPCWSVSPIPPKVEYSLTSLGQDLGTVINTVRHWAYAHMDEIEEAPRDYDRDAALK